MNNTDINDDLFKLNSKIDHIMKVICELFIIAKSNETKNELLDEKIDLCIKSINNINHKIDKIDKIDCSNNSNINSLISVPPIPPPIPPPQISIRSQSTSSQLNTYQSDFLEELKNRLKSITIE